MGSELSVCLLWHLHQPDYVDSRSGRAVMPWVRLHALLSYADTVRVAREADGARAVFNVTPVLLRQLEELAAGAVKDEWLELARAAPADLEAGQRRELLRRFFAFNHARRFPELPRLAELWAKHEALILEGVADPVAAFGDAELRDLQVGFHLAWSGRTLREDPLLRRLLARGRGFTEADKQALLDRQDEFLRTVLPALREAAVAGPLEFSCTPFAHPILPLLCDGGSARQARPELTLPRARFRRPGDAWWHVEAGLREAERLLGRRPAGMWPAEGSLSAQALAVFAAAGVRWVGCDQDVLAASLAGEARGGDHFAAWRLDGLAEPLILFRDKGLSDRIGFVYAAWPADRAAADLVGHLQRIRRSLPAGEHVVPIFLDGENPWEGYAGAGVPFLRELYRQVAAAEGLRWRTIAEHLEAGGGRRARVLPRLVAGSWIRHDFTTWIGHPVKNAGWDLVARTRDWLEPRLAEAGALRPVSLPGGLGEVRAPDPDRLLPGRDDPPARAWSAMASAEGSDWFWWYGEEHPTDFGREFDALLRGHLAAARAHLGGEPDPRLEVPLVDPRAAPAIRPARFPLAVTLDGRVTSYFEWLDAGVCEAVGGGAMHRAEAPVSRLLFGGAPDRLYLRLDPPRRGDLSGLAGLTLTVRRPDAAGREVSLRFPAPLAGPGRLAGEDGVEAAWERIVEVAVPWPALGLAAGERAELVVALARGEEVEVLLPAAGALSLRVPVAPDDSEDWLV